MRGGVTGADQSLHGAVQHISVVASELGVGTLQGRVSGGLGLLDTIVRRKLLANSASFIALCSPHSSFPIVVEMRRIRRGREAGGFQHTRYGEPSWTGCAETSSLTLFAKFVSQLRLVKQIYPMGALVRTGHCD